MQKLTAVVLGTIALGLAGCGGGEDAGQPAAGDVSFDRAFIDAMVPHHQAAIEMAGEAKDTGLTQPDLIKVADDILATQQTEIDQMLAWREEWFGSRDVGPEENALATIGVSAGEAGMEHSGMSLSTAGDVDQAFAEMMIEHHEGAVTMARIAQGRADHDEIVGLAGEIIAAQEREIDVMRPHAEGAHG
ncbi:MAG: DUF305 domain-containing protein [Gaiellaceae bacterium]